MNKLLLITFAVFASTILLTQVVSSAEAKYSEARKKAKEREDLLVEEERTGSIKKLNATATVNTINKSVKTKAEVDAINAAYLSALNAAKANLKQAKEDLNLANRAYIRYISNNEKKLAVTSAETAVENAEVALQVVLLNKP